MPSSRTSSLYYNVISHARTPLWLLCHCLEHHDHLDTTEAIPNKDGSDSMTQPHRGHYDSNSTEAIAARTPS
ncbi:hypothetical protein GBA52_010478 [Prunus armeniaca]|nr:hypothetical protein GBA52_010478 [Prunus armeniaca]